MSHHRMLAAGLALAVAGCTDPGGALLDLGQAHPPGQEAAAPGLSSADAHPAVTADGLPAGACEPTSPRSAPTAVFTLPEAGEAPFLEVLGQAQASIDVMIYLMGYGGILDALKAKAQAGLAVRVILDEGKASTNQKYFDELQAAGVTVRWSDPKFPYMHAKAIVVDGARAVISTGNFSKKYSIDLERNFVAQVADPDDVADLAALFEADWQRTAPDLSCTRWLVSPHNARQRLLAFIDSATATLDIESMQFADTEVRERVAARQAAGVAVRALLADPGWIDANAGAATFLKERGIAVRHFPHCHVKAILVDGARAYLGSENLSYTSLSKNREVGLILTEPAAIQTMADTFAGDWAGATPF